MGNGSRWGLRGGWLYLVGEILNGVERKALVGW